MVTSEEVADRSLHPTPQRTRTAWTDLCGEWQFGYDDDDRGVDQRWFAGGETADEAFSRTIMVPYPPESALSGIADTGFHPVVWYRRSFAAPATPPGGRLLLHFGAVDYHATVWLNGVLLGRHTGGQTPFVFDATGALSGDGPQVVVVRAEDQPTDVAQPRGKQDWRPEPNGIFYGRTTGIWQPVWLEPVGATHVTSLHWTPDTLAGRVGVEIGLNRVPAAPVVVDVRLRLGDEELAHHRVTASGDDVSFDIALPAWRHGMARERLTWSPESPTLLAADVTVSDGDGAELDRVGSYLGMRSAGFRDGRFLLNGKPYYLRLVLEQGYWPQSHLAAPDAAALRAEVELVKSLGFNGARVHQKVEDPRFLYWCDRLGLLVWGEMANAFTYSRVASRRLVREWLDVVERDRSHPCIVTWVPLNESWGVAGIAESAEQRHFATALYHLTRSLDPTRPVISNDGWEMTETDIFGVHDYAPHGTSLRERWADADGVRRMLTGSGPGRRRVLLGDPGDPSYQRGQPVVITEFGGLSFAPSAGQKWFGYGTVTTSDQLLERFTELVTALLDSPEIAGFCYTQLTDTLQERNGLVDEHRVPKLPAAAVREVVTRPSRAIPAELVDSYRRAAQRASAGE